MDIKENDNVHTPDDEEPKKPEDYPHEGDQFENRNENVSDTNKNDQEPVIRHVVDEDETDSEPVNEKKTGQSFHNNNDDDDDDDDDYDDNPAEKKMPFLDHLEELRWTILRSLVAIVIGTIVSYIFSKEIITFLRRPAPEDLKLIFLGPTEGFMVYIKVSIYAGIVLVFPYIAYQLWKFIVPGLLEKEKKYVPHITFFTVFNFFIGAAFAYFVIIPFGLNFLLSFQTDFLEANITIGKYLGFVVTIILVFGVVFEMPILAFFLTRIGLLTPEFLVKNRRYGIVVIFIAAAVLTPPDIFTQLMLAFPLILLYEISIFVSRAVRKKKEASEQA